MSQEWLLDLAEELPDSLHGFRIFISIDYQDINLEWKKVPLSWFSSRYTHNVIIWESIIKWPSFYQGKY